MKSNKITPELKVNVLKTPKSINLDDSLNIDLRKKDPYNSMLKLEVLTKDIHPIKCLFHETHKETFDLDVRYNFKHHESNRFLKILRKAKIKKHFNIKSIIFLILAFIFIWVFLLIELLVFMFHDLWFSLLKLISTKTKNKVFFEETKSKTIKNLYFYLKSICKRNDDKKINIFLSNMFYTDDEFDTLIHLIQIINLSKW